MMDEMAFKGFGAVKEPWVYQKFDPEPSLEGNVAGWRTALLCLALVGEEGTDHELLQSGYSAQLTMIFQCMSPGFS